MNEPVKEMMLPCLEEWGFEAASENAVNKEGHCYTLKNTFGEGYYWYYEREGMFALAVMDLCLIEDTVIEHSQPGFVSVTYYDTVSAEQLTPYKRLNANCVRGHVANGDGYRVRYHKNIPIRGMELMLVPGYFRDYLSQRYPDRLPDMEDIVLRIDGISDFTELILLLRQIQGFRGTGISAHLFYESKVAEIVSLIIHKTADMTAPVYRRSKEISSDDMQNLDTVKAYISDHFASALRAEQLAKMACMSQSKLRYSFKNVCGCTITEFIQNKRMAQAEYLLLQTDLQIYQIANAVGYHHAGRFSSLFQKSIGLLPEEYRRYTNKKESCLQGISAGAPGGARLHGGSLSADRPEKCRG